MSEKPAKLPAPQPATKYKPAKNQTIPPKKAGTASSKAEKFRRLEVVEDAMSEGIYTRKALIEHLVAKGFPRVSRSAMDGYVRAVRERWENERIEDRKILRDEAIQRLRKYLTTMVKKLVNKDPNYSDLVALLKELHKIEGVYAPEEYKVSVSRDFDGWTDDELEAYANTGEEPPRLKTPKNPKELKEPERENHANGRVLH